MVGSSNFEGMSSEERERFFRLSDFVGELNRRLFSVEELLSEVDQNSETFQTLTTRNQNLANAIQELGNDLRNILPLYGLSR